MSQGDFVRGRLFSIEPRFARIKIRKEPENQKNFILLSASSTLACFSSVACDQLLFVNKLGSTVSKLNTCNVEFESLAHEDCILSQCIHRYHSKFGVICLQVVSNQLDKNVDPCKDFYSYACGGFFKTHHLTADQSPVSGFTIVNEDNMKVLRKAMETAASNYSQV